MSNYKVEQGRDFQDFKVLSFRGREELGIIAQFLALQERRERSLEILSTVILFSFLHILKTPYFFKITLQEKRQRGQSFESASSNSDVIKRLEEISCSGSHQKIETTEL